MSGSLLPTLARPRPDRASATVEPELRQGSQGAVGESHPSSHDQRSLQG